MLAKKSTMKSICLLALVTAGYFVNAQSSEANQGTGGRVGYVDMQYIVSQLPEMKAIQADMQSTQTQLRTQIQKKSAEVEKQYTDFNANAGTMADSVRAKQQAALEQALGELEQMQQDAQRTLQNKQKLYMAPLYLKVSNVIDEVAKENGLEIVLSSKVGEYSFLLYQDTTQNISGLVLKKLGVDPASK